MVEKTGPLDRSSLDYAISVEGLGKIYRGVVSVKTTDWSVFIRTLCNIVGFKIPIYSKKLIKAQFSEREKALGGVTFQVEPGTVVAFRGASGSGKSTLLQILAGVTPPTTGRAELRGRVNKLIRNGENLQPILNAHENIREHMRLMNFVSYDEDLTSEIIAFAGLEGFEEIPVRRYSSGMQMRLSMALALHGDLDILLIDDVLRVGDLVFQHRVEERIIQLKGQGKTILIVSSQDEFVGTVADRVIELDEGVIGKDYLVGSSESGQDQHLGEVDVHSSGMSLRGRFIECSPLRSTVVNDDDEGKYVLFSFSVEVEEAQDVRVLIDVRRGSEYLFRSLSPSFEKYEKGQCGVFTVRLPLDILNNGVYCVDVAVVSQLEGDLISLKSRNAATIRIGVKVEGDGLTASPPIRSNLNWTVGALEVESQ
jgi:lipopolysaccharide transport system ATP-binding protein